MISASSTSQAGLDVGFKKATLAQEAVASEHQQEEMQQEEERKDEEEEEEKETEGGAAEGQWPPGPEGQSCSPATDSACASMPCAILFVANALVALSIAHKATEDHTLVEARKHLISSSLASVAAALQIVNEARRTCQPEALKAIRAAQLAVRVVVVRRIRDCYSPADIEAFEAAAETVFKQKPLDSQLRDQLLHTYHKHKCDTDVSTEKIASRASRRRRPRSKKRPDAHGQQASAEAHGQRTHPEAHGQQAQPDAHSEQADFNMQAARMHAAVFWSQGARYAAAQAHFWGRQACAAAEHAEALSRIPGTAS